jgi:hypothetical protein
MRPGTALQQEVAHLAANNAIIKIDQNPAGIRVILK